MAIVGIAGVPYHSCELDFIGALVTNGIKINRIWLVDLYQMAVYHLQANLLKQFNNLADGRYTFNDSIKSINTFVGSAKEFASMMKPRAHLALYASNSSAHDREDMSPDLKTDISVYLRSTGERRRESMYPATKSETYIDVRIHKASSRVFDYSTLQTAHDNLVAATLRDDAPIAHLETQLKSIPFNLTKVTRANSRNSSS